MRHKFALVVLLCFLASTYAKGGGGRRGGGGGRLWKSLGRRSKSEKPMTEEEARNMLLGMATLLLGHLGWMGFSTVYRRGKLANLRKTRRTRILAVEPEHTSPFSTGDKKPPPSGRWVGRYTESGKTRKTDYHLTFHEASQTVEGTGEDADGSFELQGFYNAHSGAFSWEETSVKQKLTVDVTGNMLGSRFTEAKAKYYASTGCGGEVAIAWEGNAAALWRTA